MLEFLVILLYWASAAVMAFIAEFLTTFVAPVVKVSKAKLKNSIDHGMEMSLTET